MLTVYKITNLINNKSYIGSSIRVEKRLQQHRNCAFNIKDSRYNYPLYQAFRKYGLENFKFEILKNDFKTIKEMTDYEKEMIIFYNSIKHGYNQTLETDRNNNCIENANKHTKQISQKCAKIDKNNNILEQYESYHDAARKNGYDGEYRASSIRQVCKGEVSSLNGNYFRDLDDNGNIIELPFKSYKARKRIICISLDNPNEIQYYNSILEASEILGLNRQSLSKHIAGSARYSKINNCLFREIDENNNIIDNGIDIEEKIQEYNNANPIIFGVRKSITEWCNLYNIKPATYRARIKTGKTPYEALTLKVKGSDKK